MLCFTISHVCWMVLRYTSCLLVWYLTISHACVCGGSLQDMPSSVVPHCRLCLLVCWLTIGHACWCSIARTPMSVGMVPHYRPCLLVRCQCTNIWLAKCSWKRDGYWFVKLVSFHPALHLEYIKFWVMHQLHICNSESVKVAFSMQIPGVCRSRGKFLYFCNKLQFWRPFCLYSYFIYLVKSLLCLQLDLNFITNNLRGKRWVWDNFQSPTMFSLIIDLHLGRHLGYIETLKDARVASLGFFKDNVYSTRISKEKSLKSSSRSS